MLFILNLLSAAWTIPDPPESAQLLKDLAAVESSKVNTIALEVAKCASAKIHGYQPCSEEIGHSDIAGEYLRKALDDCGYEPALMQIRDRLKAAIPMLSSQDLDRLQSVVFAFPALGLILAANKVFRVNPPSTVEAAPVEIPRPCNATTCK